MAWTLDVVKPAYCCNPLTLKHFREQRGWTQAGLAKVAGYSERLISKAEGGRSISSETIANLAEALSTPNQTIFPEDLIADPLECARKYIEGLYVHQICIIDHVRSFLADDVEFRVAGSPEVIPFAGCYRGIAEIERLFAVFFSLIEAPASHDFRSHYRFIAQGNEVVVWGESWLHPIGKPLTAPMPMTHLMRFQRGKLVYLEDRFDTELAMKVLQPPIPVDIAE